MDLDTLREICMAKPGATEELQWEVHLLYKVGGKIFLLIGLEEGNRFNAKCDPDWAIELREHHSEIVPGFHMNKKHWNTVHMDGNLSKKQLCDMIDHSYDLVLKSLPKKLQAEIAAIN